MRNPLTPANETFAKAADWLSHGQHTGLYQRSPFYITWPSQGGVCLFRSMQILRHS